MKSEELKREIEQWIANGCNYNQGVNLYQKYGKNKTLMKIFPGKEKSMATKLMYELCKTSGINYQTTKLNIHSDTTAIQPVEPLKDTDNQPNQETIKRAGSIFSRLRNIFK